MNNFLNITRVQVLTLFPKGKKQKRSTALLILMGLGLFLFISLYSFIISIMFCAFGFSDVLAALLYGIGSIVILITTVLKTSGLLFNNRDYELLTALPIKTSTLILSRLTAMYLINFFFTLSLMLPSAFAFMIFSQQGALFYVLYLLSCFFVPLIPLAISTFIGIVTSFIASRFRFKNVVAILLSFIALFGVMYFSMRSSDISDESIETFSASFYNLLASVYPPAILYNAGVYEGNLLYFLLFVLISVAAAAVTVAVLAPLYKKIYTALNTYRARKNYTYKAEKVNSPLSALYKKEMKRYLSSTTYVVNTAFSPLMLLLLAIVTCFVPLENMLNIEGLGDISGYVPIVLPYIASIILCMAPTTPASLSLEGKSLWIMQSIPVPQHTVMNAKMLVNLTITIPAILICSIIFKFSLSLTVPETLLILIIALAFVMFSTTLGLLLNIMFPNYNWINEAAAVKQSLSVTIMVFGIMIVGVACTLAAVFLPIPYFVTGIGISLVLLGLSALFAFLCYRHRILE